MEEERVVCTSQIPESSEPKDFSSLGWAFFVVLTGKGFPSHPSFYSFLLTASWGIVSGISHTVFQMDSKGSFGVLHIHKHSALFTETHLFFSLHTVPDLGTPTASLGPQLPPGGQPLRDYEGDWGRS